MPGVSLASHAPLETAFDLTHKVVLLGRGHSIANTIEVGLFLVGTGDIGRGHARSDTFVVRQPHHITGLELRQVAHLRAGYHRQLAAVSGAEPDFPGFLVYGLDLHRSLDPQLPIGRLGSS